MTEQSYKKVFSFLKRKNLVGALVAILKVATALVYITYPSFLVWAYFFAPERLIVSVLAPFISFIGVTVFRNIKNAKRPYEVFRFTPLIPKKSGGKSFPSRHTFSAFVIAVSLLATNLVLGSCLLILGVIIATSRVVLGLHFIKDVSFGALIGILCGAWCFVF